ncbi:hypothetical protein [Streptomyces sp. RKCA744]|uniref:hypothetical protein n=1 Tax=Streptomyces TaxID=1883 RepID=UPI00209EF0A5|nr:hypothetical protein [Streptomyces sp. RKCA744]MCO8302823.1 hypothetical protein [Streptomyces sp. RKCA744]
MAKNQRDTETVVNIASPGSVVGIQCGGSISGSTVVVNGGGRWLDDPDEMDRSLIDDLDD